MCVIFLRGEAALFEKKSRSMRVDGHVTSICVELIIWDLLERISNEQGLKLSQFISELYREGMVKTGKVNNLSSVLRVACLNYLSHEQAGLGNHVEMPMKAMSL